MIAIILALSTITSITYGLNATEYYEARIKTSELGNYDIEVESHEVPSHEYLPIIGKEYFPYSVENFQSEVDNKYPYAVYASQPVVKVDIVFATGELDQIEAYKNYMATFTSLVQGGRNSIDANIDVLVQEVKTEESKLSSNDYDIDKILNSWMKVGANVWSASGGDLYCRLPGGTGNGSWQATALLCPDVYDCTDLTIEFTVDASSADLMEGICWRVTKNSDGTYNGYFLNVGTHWHQGISLMKFEHCDLTGDFRYGDLGRTIWCGFTGPNWRSMRWDDSTGPVSGNTRYTTANGHRATVTHLDTYGSELSGKVKMEMKGNHIDVYYNNSLIMRADDSQFPEGTYGFWGNNCECSTSMRVRDICITTEKLSKKTLGESIQDVAWRDGSIRFVVHATDIIPKECSTDNPNRDADFAYTIAKLLNSNAYLVNLGRDVNRESLLTLLDAIKQADGTEKGTYFYNKPISNAMDKSAEYILDIARNLVKPTNWILVNTEVTWNTEYKDNEKDAPLNYGEHSSGNTNRKQPQDLFDEQILASYGTPITYGYTDDKILAEKWRYRHFPQYFDNSSILAGFAGQWIPDPVEVFEFTGKYRINYKRKDNPFHSDQSLTNIFDNYRYWSTNYDYIIKQ